MSPMKKEDRLGLLRIYELNTNQPTNKQWWTKWRCWVIGHGNNNTSLLQPVNRTSESRIWCENHYPLPIIEGERRQRLTGTTRKIFCIRKKPLFMTYSGNYTSRIYHYSEFYYPFNFYNFFYLLKSSTNFLI